MCPVLSDTFYVDPFIQPSNNPVKWSYLHFQMKLEHVKLSNVPKI